MLGVLIELTDSVKKLFNETGSATVLQYIVQVNSVTCIKRAYSYMGISLNIPIYEYALLLSSQQLDTCSRFI